MNKNKILSGLLIFGLGIATFIIVAIGIQLVPLSFATAKANPEIAHMRVPVLIMAWFILACILAIVVLAVALFGRIIKNKVFEQKSVSLLKAMGISSLVPIPVLIALVLYTMNNVAGSITNLWAFFGIMVCMMASIFFFLISSLFQNAVDYKTENELTV